MIKTKPHYTPEVCEHCGQSTTYLLPIDRGTVDIVKAIATAIHKKGVNVIHPRKEMEVSNDVNYEMMVRMGVLTSNQVGNLSRPRFHGLIAKVRDNPGNYCLTTKGADFLKGKVVPRFAVVSKAQGHQIGYYMPELYTCTVKEFSPDMDYWEGISYDIVNGQIVKPAMAQTLGI